MLLSPLPRAAALAVAAIFAGVTGCKDVGKASEEHATTTATNVAKRATEDVAQVVRGLPLGATELASLLAKGGASPSDLTAVRQGLRRIRADVPDLTNGNSTFFALVDPAGVALRNDLEQDVMAGQDVFKIFPALAAAKDGGVVNATGLFAGARPPGEPDRDWVAATAVHDEHGALLGYLLTGWTLRRFAYHLQESLKHDLVEEQAKTDDPGKLPIVYVSVFDKNGLYSSPLTPPVNEKTLADLDLVGKTAAGSIHGRLTITEREFGYAAQRLPTLEPDSGIVVLWSEI